MTESELIRCICLDCKPVKNLERRVDYNNSLCEEKDYHEAFRKDDLFFQEFKSIVEASKNEYEVRKHPKTRIFAEKHILAEVEFNFGIVCEIKKYYSLSIFWYEKALVLGSFRYPILRFNCFRHLCKICTLKKDFEKIYDYGKRFPIMSVFDDSSCIYFFNLMGKGSVTVGAVGARAPTGF